MNDLNFEIIEHIGVIAKYNNKWTKELNKISWNGSNPQDLQGTLQQMQIKTSFHYI